MRRFSFISIILLIVLRNSSGLNFKQVGYIPQGQNGPYGFIRVFDTNHNGLSEIIFNYHNPIGQPDSIVIFEYTPLNHYNLADVIITANGFCFWNVGNLDNDSLCDVVIQGPTQAGGVADSIRVYESPNYNAYPDSLVWKEKVTTNLPTAPCYICDLDRDNKNEIITSFGATETVFIFENISNNQYELVFTDNVSSYTDGIGIFAFDDWDTDSLMEFVSGGSVGHIVMWECIGDNQYEVIFNDSVSTSNVKDFITNKDLDNDGKPEFIVGGHHNPGNFTWTGTFTFFESIGNNTYQKIFIDSIVDIETWPYWWSASSSGDIDADCITEAVLAVADNWFIYEATGNNTFQRIYQGYPFISGPDNGWEFTSIYVYDINQNGYAEIIEGCASTDSVNSATKIWEIEAVKVLYPNGGEVFQPATQETIRWRKFTPPGADSFELLISFNNGLDYQTIVTIGQSDESLFVWTVPDTSSDSCLIAIKAFGPGVGWDESDSVFKIGGPGIEEGRDMRCQIRDVRLEQNYPNPFKQITEIRYQIPVVGQGFSLAKSKPEGLPYISVRLKIYNVTGQLVSTLIDKPQKPGYYEVQWQAMDIPAGVYFCVFEVDSFRVIRKMVLIR